MQVAAAAAISLYTIGAVLVLDAQGERLLAKYYPQALPQLHTLKAQQTFEQLLFERTRKAPGNEIVMVEGLVAVYRTNLDVFVYVVGGARQNELVLAAVLETYFETLSDLLKPQLDKKTVLENYDVACLALDEILDKGVVLETDSKEVQAKVAKPGHGLADIQLSEQSLQSAFKLAKDHMRSFLKQ